MCPPDYFGIEYEINPWMQGNIGQAHHATAIKQWQALYKILKKHDKVELIPAQPKLPDMCFAANAGLVSGNTFIPARFKFKERQGEEAHFIKWFQEKNYTIKELPKNIYFEGEGDALFQSDESLLWVGYGMRTDIASHDLLKKILNVEVVSLHLTNPHYYHLDTCFIPLPGKRAVYYADAFDEASLKKLRDYFPEKSRLELTPADASLFACNAIVCDDLFICNNLSQTLELKLREWGFYAERIPMSEFMLAGGAAKCLVLKLSQENNI